MIHSTAVIDCEPLRSNTLARKIKDHPKCIVPASAAIGAFAVLYRGVTLGENVVVGEKASIREGTVTGDSCLVGASTIVGYDVTLGNNVRIQALAFVAGGTKIGDNTFIGQGVMTTNDDDPTDYRHKQGEPPIIGANCMIGAGAIIRGGITIGDGAIIAMGALVVDDVPPRALIIGPKAIPRPFVVSPR
jgi:acetyltransferase-like isoleucine patch superfamily enzyme